MPALRSMLEAELLSPPWTSVSPFLKAGREGQSRSRGPEPGTAGLALQLSGSLCEDSLSLRPALAQGAVAVAPACASGGP